MRTATCVKIIEEIITVQSKVAQLVDKLSGQSIRLCNYDPWSRRAQVYKGIDVLARYWGETLTWVDVQQYESGEGNAMFVHDDITYFQIMTLGQYEGLIPKEVEA